ncbi:sarcosine oxidase subunit gamma [Maritimibacter sp. 55A14]|uniref:sarcosine oxidase subunit gamma n=1 Tax=Maritimibacter sp. 55A14 TaxID=2174844 RepID=UPI000D615D57|nr:sarcosine oxidase subunit gamma family protein [Maritimibacter sp. 55A14]PWE33795.1 sarcosine oxidase subunit gamma [Maritimibacter sp. 55A14]
MPDLTLTPTPPLDGYAQDFAGTRLAEASELAIVAVATPAGGETALEAAVKAAYGTGTPAPGASILSKDGKARLVWSGPDQMFLLFTHDAPDAEAGVAAALGQAGYCTDQTGVWAALEISGPGVRGALERLCPLDLHPDAFAEGAAARTVMEHMGAFVIRTGSDAFLLLSASSSAKSFLHAVELSVRNTA